MSAKSLLLGLMGILFAVNANAQSAMSQQLVTDFDGLKNLLVSEAEQINQRIVTPVEQAEIGAWIANFKTEATNGLEWTQNAITPPPGSHLESMGCFALGGGGGALVGIQGTGLFCLEATDSSFLHYNVYVATFFGVGFLNGAAGMADGIYLVGAIKDGDNISGQFGGGKIDFGAGLNMIGGSFVRIGNSTVADPLNSDKVYLFGGGIMPGTLDGFTGQKLVIAKIGQLNL